MKLSLLLLIIIGLSSEGLTQQDEKVLDKTIYMQRGKLFRPYFIYKGREIPVGRNYENLLPIMWNYPEAENECRRGVELLGTGNIAARILSMLLISTPITLEQMLEHDKDEYVPITGVALYAGIVGSYIISYKKSRAGINVINKSIWIYNHAVAEEYYLNRLAKE